MSGERIAVVVAHPDDEVLAFGGVICRHADAGDEVHVLFLATGLAARGKSPTPDALAKLRREARAASGILGVSGVKFADFPDNRMDSVPLLDVVKRIERFIDAVEGTTVYTHHVGDLNIDHTVVARAALTACRPLPGARVRRLVAGEVLSSSAYTFADSRFQPTVYVGIEPYVERKCDALRCYTQEIRSWPHPRSAQAVALLAQIRGSECGLAAAEALCLIREVRA